MTALPVTVCYRRLHITCYVRASKGYISINSSIKTDCLGAPADKRRKLSSICPFAPVESFLVLVVKVGTVVDSDGRAHKGATVGKPSRPATESR